MRVTGWAILVAVAGSIPACTAPRPNYVVSDSDPSVKIPAIKRSVDRKGDDDDDEAGTVRQLVKDLDSDDPAVRFYAIEGLRRLTGQTFEYVYYEDADERKPAVARWNAWLTERDGGPKHAVTSGPSSE
jgi:hypothetical protein